MVELEQEKIEEFEVSKKEGTFKKVLFWMGKNVKFILIPGSKLEELSIREFEYEKTISKRKFIRRLKSVLTIIGIVIVFTVVSFAVFGDWLSPYTYYEASLPYYPGAWDPPSPGHLLGQTRYGRDILARLIFGARSSLTIALPAITFSVILGVIFGVISGFYGGVVDSIIMRVMDVFLAFPGLILALVFVAILGQNMEYIMLAFGILGVPFYSRLIRASVLQARELPYVEAARVAGSGNMRIMFRHVLPNTIQPIIISFTFNIGGIILSLAGLSFLGYSDIRLIEWGSDINQASMHLYDAPWAAIWPGVMILLTVLGFMLVGDGLRDALDPRLKNI
ncbi:MAG: ABC transporter permease [Candidatus Hodarchaeota archaeon]